VADHLRGVEAGRRGERLEHRRPDTPTAPHGHQLRLRIQLEAIAHTAVQVDRQAGQPDRPTRQHHRVQPDATVRASHGEPTRDGQLAVQPGVRQQPAVRLHPHQPVRPTVQVVARPDLEGRRVGVRPHQPQAGVGERGGADPEGDQAAAVPDDEAAVTGRQRPALALLERRESGLRQPADHLGHRVEGRRGGVDEGAQVRAGRLRSDRHAPDASGPSPCALVGGSGARLASTVRG
jgi:hypothetical protein